MKNIDLTIETLEANLIENGFKTSSKIGCFETDRTNPRGFLRVAIDSESVNTYMLTRNCCLEWKLEVSLYTPVSILLATLRAAMDEANA